MRFVNDEIAWNRRNQGHLKAIFRSDAGMSRISAQDDARRCYANESDRIIAQIAAQVEAAGCAVWPRDAEIMQFADHMEAKHLGIATFFGLIRESRILHEILTAKGEAEDIRFGKELGADDYLLKPIYAEDLMAAILGKLKRYDQLKEQRSGPSTLNEATQPTTKAMSAFPTDLSSRELDVLRLMVQGLSNNEIAEALFIEQSPVKTHVSNILSKLGVRNRVEAVTFALQSGFTHTE